MYYLIKASIWKIKHKLVIYMRWQLPHLGLFIQIGWLSVGVPSRHSSANCPPRGMSYCTGFDILSIPYCHPLPKNRIVVLEASGFCSLLSEPLETHVCFILPLEILTTLLFLNRRLKCCLFSNQWQLVHIPKDINLSLNKSTTFVFHTSYISHSKITKWHMFFVVRDFCHRVSFFLHLV